MNVDAGDFRNQKPSQQTDGDDDKQQGTDGNQPYGTVVGNLLGKAESDFAQKQIKSKGTQDAVHEWLCLLKQDDPEKKNQGNQGILPV